MRKAEGVLDHLAGAASAGARVEEVGPPVLNDSLEVRVHQPGLRFWNESGDELREDRLDKDRVSEHHPKSGGGVPQ